MTWFASSKTHSTPWNLYGFIQLGPLGHRVGKPWHYYGAGDSMQNHTHSSRLVAWLFLFQSTNSLNLLGINKIDHMYRILRVRTSHQTKNIELFLKRWNIRLIATFHHRVKVYFGLITKWLPIIDMVHHFHKHLLLYHV